MKFQFILLIMFVNNTLFPLHDVPLAIFHITQSNEIVNLDINFDLNDYSQSLDIKSTDVNIDNMQCYLDEHTSFRFNAQTASIKISEVKIVRDHIRVKGSFGKVEKNISSIEIENTCLNNVSRHSNIIQVDLNNSSKDYRMHKKRTKINLSY